MPVKPFAIAAAEKGSSLFRVTAACSVLTARCLVRRCSKIKLVVLEAASCPLLAHSGHRLVRCTCLLLTQSGHWPQGQLADSRLREQPPQVTNKQRNGQEVAMSEGYNLELISRRRAFSFLGLAAALSVAVPATVVIAMDA